MSDHETSQRVTLERVCEKSQSRHGLPRQLVIEALTYIRGRSLPDSFIIVDEAQNLTKHEMKTVVSRVGENSKIVLLGDTEQIDHPYLDTLNNGLTHLIETMKDQPLAGHVKLIKDERSALAQLAADLL
ncbi:MAG: PhoH family protein [Firmicutes bacterium]|nr:PhoH family protein [Bacillota bacterium]